MRLLTPNSNSGSSSVGSATILLTRIGQFLQIITIVITIIVIVTDTKKSPITGVSAFIINSPTRSYIDTTSASIRLSNANNEEEGENKEKEEDSNDLSWMKKAMGTDEIDQGLTSLSSTNDNDKIPLKSGIAGFAVDPKLGFVCILASSSPEEEENNEPTGNLFTYAIVSPTDTEKLSSPEALCLVQLAGGLDLGAAVFPPETLARVICAELEEEDEDDDESEELMSVEKEESNIVDELRSKVTLLDVTVLPNENYEPQPSSSNKSTNSNDEGDDSSSPERKANMEANAVKILPAIKNLPGLGTVTSDQILKALTIYADKDGNLEDRQSFSELLARLRNNGAGSTTSSHNGQMVKFQITASILEEDGDNNSDGSLRPAKLVTADHVYAFQAIALSLRYKVPISVSEACFSNKDVNSSNDGRTVWELFPAFKPIQELMEDAKIMDGFISSMFFKERSAPDNDDKA